MLEAGANNEHQEAQAHVAAVEPLWTMPLFEAIEDMLPRPASSQVLVAESRCGYLPLHMVEQLPEDSRIIALDPSRAMLDQARQRMDESLSRRVFFVPQRLNDISYADGVFQASICIHGVVSRRHADEGLRELCRVTKAGGQVLLSAPLLQSFPLFYDMLDEAMRALELDEPARRLEKARANLLDVATLADCARRAGLHGVQVQELSWQMQFKSGRHLLIAPLVRETFFPHWLGAVRSDDRDTALRYISDAIDTYFHHHDITTEFCVGVLTAQR